MKKGFLIIVAIFTIFMVQLGVVGAYTKGDVNEDGNVNLDDKYNNFKTETKSCGNELVKDIPATIPKVTRIVYMALQVVTPIILVVLGMIDLVKAVTSQKEENVKKAQGTFIKRLISAGLVFSVFVIVKLLVSIVAPDNDESDKLEEDRKVNRIMSCVDCFLNGTDNCDE